MVSSGNTPPAIFAGLAQLVEHLICNQQVVGSSPTAGSSIAGANGLGGREPKVRKRLVARRDDHEKRRSRAIGLECHAVVLNPTAGSSIAGANGLGGREPKVRKRLVNRDGAQSESNGRAGRSGPPKHVSKNALPSHSPLTSFLPPKGRCQSGRMSTLGKRVWR